MPADQISPKNSDSNEFRGELRELSKVIEGLSVNSNRLSAGMFLLSCIQLSVAYMQFIQSFAFSSDVRMIIWGISMVVLILIMLYYFTNKISSK